VGPNQVRFKERSGVWSLGGSRCTTSKGDRQKASIYIRNIAENENEDGNPIYEKKNGKHMHLCEGTKHVTMPSDYAPSRAYIALG